MSEHRPFIRPRPARWWAQERCRAYTIRELCGVAVALYGAILLAGVVCVWLGPEAYGGYQRILAGPWSLALHLLLLLAAVLWHVVTWFRILPKTLPKLVVRGRLVPQRRLYTGSLAFACLCSVGLLATAMLLGGLS